MTASANLQLVRLSRALELQARAREAGAAELDFLIVNDTISVVPYGQAALWRIAGSGPQLVLSGIAEPEHGPYRSWLQRLFVAIEKALPELPRAPDPEALPPDVVRDWADWFPPHALVATVRGRGGAPIALFLVGRGDTFSAGDSALLANLCGAYGHAMQVAAMPQRRLRRRRLRPRIVVMIMILTVLAISALPVRQSTLAPAEIVAHDPSPLRAPFDGVVEHILVPANSMVHAGQVLVALDRRQWETRVAVAEKALDMAHAEYDAAYQQGLSDPRAKSRLAVLQSRIAQQAAELAYNRDMLERAELRSPTDGIAVFDDANDWIGRPVTLGERIMLIASPEATEIEVQVPADDIATFDPGAEVRFFGNLAPEHPIHARLSRAAYASEVDPMGVLSYRVRAAIDPGQPQQRLGLRGTAKIFGPPKPLALWVLRRPLTVLRIWLAL
jgi:hypothetical protein